MILYTHLFFILTFQVAKAFQISPHARDSGIQIFDKFLASTLSEKQECKVDEDFISYSAAVSIILGSKLHESRRDLTMVSRKKI
jgi:hypothetical protein